MVFANLGAAEKTAFFSLLDEYFASRPEIFSGGAGNDEDAAQPPSPVAAAPTPSSVAAAQRALAANLRTAAPPSVPALPRRGTSDSAGSEPPSTGSVSSLSSARATGSVSSLNSTRKFGANVDTSSTKGTLSTITKLGKAPPPPAAVRAPAAFAPTQNKWGPPPTRGAVPPPPPPQPEPEEEEEEEETAQGEWAEALYDYSSTEAGDLQIRAGQNVWVTERTSDDWWTGDFQGKSGLFPASYVKIL